jgi:hypothetical protein
LSGVTIKPLRGLTPSPETLVNDVWSELAQHRHDDAPTSSGNLGNIWGGNSSQQCHTVPSNRRFAIAIRRLKSFYASSVLRPNSAKRNSRCIGAQYLVGLNANVAALKSKRVVCLADCSARLANRSKHGSYKGADQSQALFDPPRPTRRTRPTCWVVAPATADGVVVNQHSPTAFVIQTRSAPRFRSSPNAKLNAAASLSYRCDHSQPTGSEARPQAVHARALYRAEFLPSARKSWAASRASLAVASCDETSGRELQHGPSIRLRSAETGKL